LQNAVTAPNEEPLPHVPVILLCAEDDDLELISFVHEARQHGLEPEVVPGVESGDRPLLEAMAANEAALFVVLRSDNLTGERTLALKRAFGGAQKKGQHLLALRLDPERAATAARTIGRRLRQLMAPKGPGVSAAKAPPPPKAAPEVDEWAGTLIHEKALEPPVTARASKAAPKGARPQPAKKPAPAPSKKAGPASEPETTPGHTWSGTLIADEASAPFLNDEERTPVPADGMPTAPSTAPRNEQQSEAQWGGTLIADPSTDYEITMPAEVESDLQPGTRAVAAATRSRRMPMLLLGVVLLGGAATAFALNTSSEPESPAVRPTGEVRETPPATDPPVAASEATTPPVSRRRESKPESKDEPVEPRSRTRPRSTDRDAKALPTVDDLEHPIVPAEPVPLDNDVPPTEAAPVDAPPPTDPLPSVADEDTRPSTEKPKSADVPAGTEGP
jgi:hypothetical protein